MPPRPIWRNGTARRWSAGWGRGKKCVSSDIASLTSRCPECMRRWYSAELTFPGASMNVPVTPPYHHTPLFPLGPDKAPYRKLDDIGGVRIEKVMGKDMLVVEREALRALSEAAFTDINHLLRPAHLKQLRKILDDPEASDNDKFVAYDFLKNANIAAGGVLPMCQDTGTAIIMVKKGRMVFNSCDDEAALAE